MCPSAQNGWIGRAQRIFAVRRCLLNGSTGGDALAGLLPATQGERRRRRQPIGQDREGLIARSTNPASHPNAFVAVIVGLAEPLSMTDDRVVAANRTPPREEAHRNHPGSMLSFASGSAIKRITVWREGLPLVLSARLLRRPALTLLVYSLSNEKKNCFRWVSGHPPYGLAGIKGLHGTTSWRRHWVKTGSLGTSCGINELEGSQQSGVRRQNRAPRLPF